MKYLTSVQQVMKKQVLQVLPRYFTVVFFITSPVWAIISPTVLQTEKGISAWFVRDPSTHIISLSFAFKDAGEVSDPAGKLGQSQLAVEMLFKGAGEFSKDNFHRYAENNGIHLRASTELEYVVFDFQTLKRKKHEGLKLLKSLLYDPKFPAPEWKLVKKNTIVGLANLKHNPRYQATRVQYSNQFKGHPYANRFAMTEKTINKLTLVDLRNYKKEFLVKNRLVVALTGNLTEDEAKTLLDEIFADLPEGTHTPLKDTKPQHLGEIFHVESTIPQSVVLFLQEGLGTKDEDFIPFYMLLNVMGATGDLTSRLMVDLREKNGLVYGISVGTLPLDYSPLVVGSFQTDNNSLEKGTALLKQAWSHLKENGITKEELEKVKSKLLGEYPLHFQSSMSVVSAMLQYQLTGRPADYFTKRQQMIESVTLDKINDVAKRMIDMKKLSFVVVGPKPLKG